MEKRGLEKIEKKSRSFLFGVCRFSIIASKKLNSIVVVARLARESQKYVFSPEKLLFI